MCSSEVPHWETSASPYARSRLKYQQRRLSAPAADQRVAAPIRLRIMPHPPDAEKVPSVATIRPRSHRRSCG
jgi:hypothetical protein